MADKLLRPNWTPRLYSQGGGDLSTSALPIVFTSAGGFGSHALDVEFVGGPSGHLQNTPVGNDSDFGNWLLPVEATEAQKEIVDDATRGQVWFADQAGAKFGASIRFDFGSAIGEQEKVYVSWMVKRRKVTGTGQWKLFRITSQNDIQDQGTEMAMFEWSNGINSDDLKSRPDATPEGPNAVSLFGESQSVYPENDDQWYRMEMLLTTSQEGVKDGFCEIVRQDGVVVPTVGAFSGTEDSPLYPTVMSYNTSTRFRWFIWQNFRGNGLTDQKIWMDDLYIQVGTFRRVELCNNANYALATKREIQKILSYSDTRVEAELNTGGFPPGTYFDHLVDETNSSIAVKTVTF